MKEYMTLIISKVYKNSLSNKCETMSRQLLKSISKDQKI